MLPKLRNDFVFALRFSAAIPPDEDGQTPLIAQTQSSRKVAPFGQLARHSEAAQERASGAQHGLPGGALLHEGQELLVGAQPCDRVLVLVLLCRQRLLVFGPEGIL